MIQRIQSVYLLAVTILMIICMCTPVGSIIAGTQEISEFGNLFITLPNGTKDFAPWALFVILLVVAILSFGTIFLFKKRLVQIRLCVSELVLLVGAIAFIALYCYRLCSLLSEVTTNSIFTISFAAVMPIIAIILVILAMRAIAKDEALVRSLDRIR